MVHNGAAATTATPSAGTPSILKRLRRSSSDTPTVGGEGPQQRAAKRIKFAPNDSVGACVDPVFSDSEDEEDDEDGGDADGGDADYKNGEVTKRAKKVKAVKNNKKRAVDPVFSDDDDDNDEDDRDEDYKDEEVGKKKAKVKAVKNHNKKKAVTNKKKRTKEEDQAVVDAVAS